MLEIKKKCEEVKMERKEQKPKVDSIFRMYVHRMLK